MHASKGAAKKLHGLEPHAAADQQQHATVPDLAAAAGGTLMSAHGQPLALQLDSERLMLDARGWVGASRFVLQRPMQASADLTPQFTR